MSMVEITIRRTCQSCGETDEAKSESDYPEGFYPRDTTMWMVSFQPPNQGEVAFRQFVCEACAKKIGGAHLARQLASIKTTRAKNF